MTRNYEFVSGPRDYAELVLHDSEVALRAAVEAVNPDNPEADPLEVFPAPGEVRNEDVGLELSEEQGKALRAAAAQLGFERPNDAEPSSLGLRGAHFVIEGGQPHKIVAEASMVAGDADAVPATLIFSASPHRHITSDAEKASCENQFGEVLETEYEVARRAAESLEGFVALEEDVVLPIGYDIDADFALVTETTGQFTQIGNVGDVPVLLLRIDREDYIDELGAAKYRKQPGTDAVIRIIDSASSALSDETTPIALVTSSTYQASRSVDAARVALNADRVIGVTTYGTQRLARVNKGIVPEPKRLEQLPGELHKMAQEVIKLRDALNA
ncbi:MAG: hypothetical protein ACREGB_05260 [Candidatus Saccharimonadales bacterium]